MDPATESPPPWRLAALVAVLALAVGAATLGHGFVFDDHQNVVENRWIRDAGSLRAIFATHVAGFDPRFRTGYYRPLTHVINMATYHAVGLRAWGFHLVNVLLHAAASLLVFLVALELLPRRGLPPALAAGLVFALHPLHAEAVAWLAGMHDLAAATLTLLALWLALRGRAWGSGAALLAALLCKESAAMLLPVLAVVAWRRERDALRRLAGPAVAGAIYVAMRVAALGGLFPAGQGAPFSPLLVLALAGRYAAALFVPYPLCAYYPLAAPASPADPWVLLGAAAIAALAAGVIALRHHTVGLTALALLALPLLPALYTPALGEAPYAERYLYLPLAGFALLAGLAFEFARARIGRAADSAGVAMLVAYAAVFVVHAAAWTSDLALWTTAARHWPRSAAVQESLGYARLSSGDMPGAAAACRAALAADAARIDARTNLGAALAAMGQLDDARREYEAVLARSPRAVAALTGLGLVWMGAGRADLAIDAYRRAIEVDANYAEAHNDLGVALARTGRVDDAARALAEAVRLAPENAEYSANLAALRGGR